MRTKKGVITSAKMQNTVTVTVHGFAFHPIYKKRFRKSKKFLADTNGHDVQEGDTVLIAECRPMSKRKYFRVSEVIKQVPRVSEVKEEEGLEKAIHREKQAPEIVKKEEGKKEGKVEGKGEKGKGEEEKERGAGLRPADGEGKEKEVKEEEKKDEETSDTKA